MSGKWRKSLGGDLLCGFFGQTTPVFRCQNFAGDGGSRLDNEAADFTSEFGEHAGVILGGSFAGLGDDLFRGGDGLLRFLLLHACSSSASLFNELAGLGIGLNEDFLALGFGVSQLGFDFFSVGEAVGDALAARFEHSEDALVSEQVQAKTNDAKADRLSNEVRPIHTKLFGDLFNLPAAIGLGEHDNRVHKNWSGNKGRRAGWALRPSLLACYFARNRA